MDPAEAEAAWTAAERAERGLVRLLGGYTVGLPGGTLLVNERLPDPRWNRVQSVRVGRMRGAQFFESALDHYFQRALRPEFRAERPVPEHVDGPLRALGFRPRPAPELWLAAAGRELPEHPGVSVEVAEGEVLTELAGWWAPGHEAVELRRQLEVGVAHPNPGEELEVFRSVAATGASRSAGLAYRRGSCLVLESIATAPPHRGRGAATAWVLGVLGQPIARRARTVALRSAEPRLAERLSPHGFRTVATGTVYALDPAGSRASPAPGPSTGPLWRPPRTGGSSGD